MTETAKNFKTRSNTSELVVRPHEEASKPTKVFKNSLYFYWFGMSMSIYMSKVSSEYF